MPVLVDAVLYVALVRLHPPAVLEEGIDGVHDPLVLVIRSVIEETPVGKIAVLGKERGAGDARNVKIIGRLVTEQESATVAQAAVTVVV